MPKIITISIIKRKLKTLPNTKNFYLVSKKYQNRNKPLRWVYLYKNKRIYFNRSWKQFQQGLRIPCEHHWNISKIKGTILKLPNAKNYFLLSNKYISMKSPLSWEYYYNNKIHYFNMSWYSFYKKGLRFKNTDLSNRDILQEISNVLNNNKFNVLYITHENNPYTKYYVLLQHNSAKCNYHCFWTKMHSIMNGKNLCPKCYSLARAKDQLYTNSEIIRKVYNQWDNHNHRYVPILSTYTKSHQLMSWELHDHNKITTFTMSLHSFLEGTRPDDKYSKNELYFELLLNKYCPNIKKDKDYFYSYKIRSHHCKRGVAFSFDFFFPNINITSKYHSLLIELNGLQHIRPVNWSYHMTKKELKQQFKHQQYRDLDKQKYCNRHHIYVLWIPCFYKSKKLHKYVSNSQMRNNKQIRKYFFKSFLPLLK